MHLKIDRKILTWRQIWGWTLNIQPNGLSLQQWAETSREFPQGFLWQRWWKKRRATIERQSRIHKRSWSFRVLFRVISGLPSTSVWRWAWSERVLRWPHEWLGYPETHKVEIQIYALKCFRPIQHLAVRGKISANCGKKVKLVLKRNRNSFWSRISHFSAQMTQK